MFPFHKLSSLYSFMWGFFIIFFSSIEKDPAKYIRQIADHIRCPLSEDTLQRVLEFSQIDTMRATYTKLEGGKREHLGKVGGVSFIAQGIMLNKTIRNGRKISNQI